VQLETKDYTLNEWVEREREGTMIQCDAFFIHKKISFMQQEGVQGVDRKEVRNGSLHIIA
jgi:hypothetical protein